MQKGTITKYQPFKAIDLSDRKWPDTSIRHAPIWASVDLRDGNQALAIPMTVEEKIEFFDLLVAIGFKEIEVGFPSASETEFSFIRRLVDENRIPEDVTVQVLVQAREQEDQKDTVKQQQNRPSRDLESDQRAGQCEGAEMSGQMDEAGGV